MMRGKIFIIFLMISGIVLSVSAQQEYREKGQEGVVVTDELYYLISYYYQHHNYERLLDLFNGVLANNRILHDKEVITPLIHFFAAIAKDDNRLFTLTKEKLWGNSNKEQREFLQAIIDQAKNFKTPYVDSLVSINSLWAEFFATGDKKPIERLVEALEYDPSKNLSQGSEDDFVRLLLSRKVLLSLARNIKDHPRLVEILQKELPNLRKNIQDKIEDILSEQLNRPSSSKEETGDRSLGAEKSGSVDVYNQR